MPTDEQQHDTLEDVAAALVERAAKQQQHVDAEFIEDVAATLARRAAESASNNGMPENDVITAMTADQHLEYLSRRDLTTPLGTDFILSPQHRADAYDLFLEKVLREPNKARQMALLDQAHGQRIYPGFTLSEMKKYLDTVGPSMA